MAKSEHIPVIYFSGDDYKYQILTYPYDIHRHMSAHLFTFHLLMDCSAGD